VKLPNIIEPFLHKVREDDATLFKEATYICEGRGPFFLNGTTSRVKNLLVERVLVRKLGKLSGKLASLSFQ